MRFTNTPPRAKTPRQKKERIIEYFDHLDDEIAIKAKHLQLIELFWNKIVKSQKPKSWSNFEKLKNENKGNILGQYIESLSGYPADSLEYQALCEGVQALMETRRG